MASRVNWRPIAIGLCLAALICAPKIIWETRTKHPLSVLIVDKTVAEPSYREHKGLVWGINHKKVVRPADGKPYDWEHDYFGYFPLPGPPGTHKEVPIPSKPGGYDMVYVADSYGVYTNDVYRHGLGGLHSRPIYGGLDSKEVATLIANVKPRGTFVGEFNSFASPTNGAPRQALCDYLGLRWDGWAGRYFNELAPDVEVPVWLVKGYEQQYRKNYAFKGPGVAYVNEDGRVAVLAGRGVDVGSNYVRCFTGPYMRKKLDAGNEVPYGYWFDIVTPRAGVEVLATYNVDATPQGKTLLASLGLPLNWPAVMRRAVPGGTTRWYFAGDFADMIELPTRYDLWGIEYLRRLVSGTADPEGPAFYWNVYFPLLGGLVSDLTH
ncbi:MAG: hypothetical protein JWM80_1606 [Cyanobacteria bacterium RYN_339]|nr:hypothetical protein [Cyanobacteria bacterium RYN_339]